MFTSLDLKPVYDSSEYNLAKDLIVPLLQNSKHYMRGVGYFTSGWLRVAAEGILGLIENGGKAEIILSPHLSEHDWRAFQLGEKARKDKALKLLLQQSMDSLERDLEAHTLNCLAWLISDNLLEFKFAVLRPEFNGGDYHDKVAIFEDRLGDIVAIHGSFNDSIKGTLNGEAFSVFKSWEPGQKAYVDKHKDRLFNLWEGQNRQFETYAIPSAIKERFIKLRQGNQPPYSFTQPRPRSPERKTVTLHEYQSDAIDSWINNNKIGIFEMATGTGKTYTSLAAAQRCYHAKGRLALIILVPYLHLLEQWASHCKTYDFMPIICSSQNANWNIKVKSKIEDFNFKAIDKICFLVVHNTAASDKFLSITKSLDPDTFMLIGDEVHGLGSRKLQKALLPNAGMRLGLSATPRRWFDEQGTRTLLSYFGSVCFEFPLEKAIGKYLTPYEYRPIKVTLTRDEMDEYEKITEQIINAYRYKSTEKDDELYESLLRKRAKLIAAAENKLNKLFEILKTLIKQEAPLSGVLVYCAPGKHKEVLKRLAKLGVKCREFVHTVPLPERLVILDQFDKGQIEVLVAVKCLDEGIDVPSTRIAFFLSSTTNPKEFIQRRGRVLRKAPGKDKALIYDFIVVPCSDQIPLKRDIDATLLKREMPRFTEFADIASNHFEARSEMIDMLDHYQILDYLTYKPWDIYQMFYEKEQHIIV